MDEKHQNIKHLAIVMDGNGRWAKSKGMLRAFGHESGVKSVREAIEYCVEHKIPYLTLYTFSSENWKRPKTEVDMLMSLLVRSLKKESENLQKNGVKLRAIGDLNSLPQEVYNQLNKAIETLKDGTSLTLTLALAYGSRYELILAMQKIAQKVVNQELEIHSITEQTINDNLLTFDLPDVDLLIRTGGECRISNFLLWQIAYSELYFTDVFWPDFTKKHLNEAVEQYHKRERRFGKTSEQLKK